MLERQQVLQALRRVAGVESDSVKGIAIRDGRVSVTLSLKGDDAHCQRVRAQAIQEVSAVAGVEAVEVSLALNLETSAEHDQGHHEHAHGESCGHDHDHSHGHGGKDRISLPGVKHILAVGAGKGGVGKSTVAVNLAAGLKRIGLKVGILDADIYGPSIATMTGIENLPPTVIDEHNILPFEIEGLKVMSIANFIDPEAAMIWRGPMIHGVVRQFLGDVQWGDLDYLVVDLPPGTGDVPITLGQSVEVAGAVVVSTPQAVAMNDAIRAARMYQQLGIRVLGLVENMSYFICDGCGKEHDIFGRGGLEKTAQRLKLPFLGRIPMSGVVRQNTDNANAAANFDLPGPISQAVSDLVRNVVSAVAKGG